MKKIALLSLTFIIAAGCSTIDVAISQKVKVSKKMKKIAVLPFEVKGARWGDEFSDSITHFFFKSGKMEVVEREAIQKVLKEQKLSMTGLVEDNQAVQIGKLLGADVIIIGRGSVLNFSHPKTKATEENLIDTFSLKAISVETGSLLITVRKRPGRAWNVEYRLKWCLSATLIWDRDDILIESSKYDDISQQIVDKILSAIEQIEAEKPK